MICPVNELNDRCDIIEINARMFEVKEFYLDAIVKNIHSQLGAKLSA